MKCVDIVVAACFSHKISVSYLWRVEEELYWELRFVLLSQFCSNCESFLEILAERIFLINQLGSHPKNLYNLERIPNASLV